MLPADAVLKNEVALDKKIVCGPVIKVSGQTIPFLKAATVELTYSNTRLAEIDEEFLPVRNKTNFTTEYGLLLHDQKEFGKKKGRNESTRKLKSSWKALNDGDDVYIERSRLDQLKFSFPVYHFSL